HAVPEGRTARQRGLVGTGTRRHRDQDPGPAATTAGSDLRQPVQAHLGARAAHAGAAAGELPRADARAAPGRSGTRAVPEDGGAHGPGPHREAARPAPAARIPHPALAPGATASRPAPAAAAFRPASATARA